MNLARRRSKKVWFEGREWDSQTELSFYKYLLTCEDVEKIELQPEFQLIPSFSVDCTNCDGTGKVVSKKTSKLVKCTKCKGNGCRIRQGTKYTADFKVTYKNGQEKIIDVKGYGGDRFNLTKKLFEYIVGIELVVVKYDKKKGFYQYR